MTVEINEFSVSDEMLWVTGQTGRRQEDCSRVAGRQQQTNDYWWYKSTIVRQMPGAGCMELEVCGLFEFTKNPARSNLDIVL